MKELFDSLRECVFAIERGGVVSYANPPAMALLGLDPRRLIGRNIRELSFSCYGTRNGKTAPFEGGWEAHAKPSCIRAEYERPDARKIVIEISLSPLPDGKAVLILRDVSEQAKLDEILARYAEGLTILYETSNTFLSHTGMRALDQALSMLGDYYGADFTVALVPSADSLELVSSSGWGEDSPKGMRIPIRDDDLAGRAMLDRCPHIVNDFSADSSFVRSDFLARSGVMSGISVPMAVDEKVFGVVMLLYRKARTIDTAELWYLNVAANALAVYIEKERSLGRAAESEAFLTSILEGIGEGVAVIDHGFRIVSANKAFLQGVKMASPEVIGKLCHNISHHSERRCSESGQPCPVAGVFATGLPQEGLHTHYSSDGSQIFVEIHAYPIPGADGTVTAVVETVTDVTERIRLERDLEKRVQELEEFYDMAVGRELRMIELKDEIKRLRDEQGGRG